MQQLSFLPICIWKVRISIAAGSTLSADRLYAGWPRTIQSLLTHGFTVDGEGRKMSKSLGNTIAPREITDTLGADILRLWVARPITPVSSRFLMKS
jgi:valyl-tRNA synthetase